MSGEADPEPPPCKKIRIDPDTDNAVIKDQQISMITTLSDDLLIVIFSFFSYQTIIVSLSKTCKLFHKLIDNNSVLCIKHFHFGTREHSILSNKLFKQISRLKNNPKDDINRFLHKFSNLESLELMTIDQTMTLMDADARIDPAVIQFYIEYFLKPLQNKLVKLTVNTWLDAALSVDSFNFGNITFNNARTVRINGKDTKYPFHITQYVPNVEKLTLSACNLMFYSLYRMVFDTKHSLKHLTQFHIYGCSFCTRLGFYESRMNELLRQNKVERYHLNELEMNRNGGKLQVFDFMIQHGFACYTIRLNVARLMILYNKNTLQTLKVNYNVFYDEISLEEVPQINGLKEFVDKTNEKEIHLPQLQHLSLTMTRITTSEYSQIYEHILFYKLIAPKLHSIEIDPGACCWHDHSGFIPFLKVLIGDQVYQLSTIKIRVNGQRNYLDSAIDRISAIYKKNKRKINIILQ